MAVPAKALDGDEAAVVRAALRQLETPRVNAGYRSIPAAEVEAIMARPAVKAAIRAGMRDRLATRSLPLAVEYLEGVVESGRRDEDRIRAAAKLADLALAADKQDAGQSDDKALAEMSVAELHAYIRRCDRELSDRAVVVLEHDNAPSAPSDAPSMADLLG